MTPKEKVKLYEAALNTLADWNLPEKDMCYTDDNGSAAMWARNLLKQAGIDPFTKDSTPTK